LYLFVFSGRGFKIIFTMKVNQPFSNCRLIYAIYAISNLFIGIPLWYLATKIQKSPLPVQRIQSLKLDHEALKHERPKTGYHITFTLAYQTMPDAPLDRQRVEDAYRKYFEEEAGITDRAFLQIDFVEKYFVEPFKTESDNLNSMSEEAFNRLKLFVNGMGIEDGDLHPGKDLYPMNFLLYTYSKNSPLREPLAFVYPKWGGVIITNSRITAKEEDGILEIAFKTFGKQLKNSITLGLELEVEEAIRVSIAHAVDALQSLVSTISTSKNIPIPPNISWQVSTSLSYIDRAQEKGLEVKERYKAALLGAEWAEMAFFDEGMLASQYFPDEHKMAVYLPIIVPVVVPLIFTLKKQLKC
jgi:hypothetical protein